MELLDVLQLVGFLLVGVIILSVLVAVDIGFAVFLYMTDRKIVIFKNAIHPHESGTPAEFRS